jgi:Fe-S oxidoreductase
MELGEPDSSGRRRPLPVEGSEFVSDFNSIILAVGQVPDTSFLEEAVGVSLSPEGYIVVDENTLASSLPGVFAGGDVVTGPKSVIDAIASGKKAAISIDRYIRGEDINAGREGEGPVESRLKVDVAGVASKMRLGMPTLPVGQRESNFHEVELGFSEAEAREEAGRCLECECELCVKDCQFLEMYCRTPKELAEKFKAGYFRENPLVPYSCNLCTLCQKLCPEDLHCGDMCREIREKMVAEGIGPLPGHESVKMDQEWVMSEAFALSKSGSGSGGGEWVFFPGCSLSAYSPELVVKVFDYLRERLPGTGIILNCCGAPAHCIGVRPEFEGMLGRLESEVNRLGAVGVLLACPECYHLIKRNASGLKVKSVYEVMVEKGLPDGAGDQAPHTFSLHDSCTARDETELMDSVREVVTMMGHQVEEMAYSRDKTRCCGAGGMVPYVDLELYLKLAERRANEASCDMLTYCAACRETFAAVGKPSIHVLDLVFSPDWPEGLYKPPGMGKARQEKQAELKKLLMRV